MQDVPYIEMQLVCFSIRYFSTLVYHWFKFSVSTISNTASYQEVESRQMKWTELSLYCTFSARVTEYQNYAQHNQMLSKWRKVMIYAVKAFMVPYE